MNIPFTHHQVRNMRLGFTSSGPYPNRKARRAMYQKQAHNPGFGAMVSRYQVAINKTTGKLKTIVHFHHIITLN